MDSPPKTCMSLPQSPLRSARRARRRTRSCSPRSPRRRTASRSDRGERAADFTIGTTPSSVHGGSVAARLGVFLRAVGVDIVTLGQYLQPTKRDLPVVSFVNPEKFRWFAEKIKPMGYQQVVSGPLV